MLFYDYSCHFFFLQPIAEGNCDLYSFRFHFGSLKNLTPFLKIKHPVRLAGHWVNLGPTLFTFSYLSVSINHRAEKLPRSTTPIHSNHAQNLEESEASHGRGCHHLAIPTEYYDWCNHCNHIWKETKWTSTLFSEHIKHSDAFCSSCVQCNSYLLIKFYDKVCTVAENPQNRWKNCRDFYHAFFISKCHKG